MRILICFLAKSLDIRFDIVKPIFDFFDFFSALEKTGDSNSDLRKNGEIGKRPSHDD